MSVWKTVRLGDVATYINGYAFKPSDWSNNGLPIIRIQNLTGNDYETNFFNGDIPEKFHIKNGDVLISWSASLGVYEWKKTEALLNQHIFKVVFDKIDVDKAYFMFTVSNLLNAMSKQTHGSTMRHITKPNFDNIPFPLPPLEIQKQIATQLDKCTSIITKHKQMLEKYDTLIKSRFIEMFGTEKEFSKWNCCCVEDVADVTVGVVIKPTQYYCEKGIPAFRSLNIGEMKVNDSDWVYFTEEGNEKNKKSILKENDVLVVRSGAPGKSCVITKKYEGFNVVDAIIAHPNLEKVNPVFLCMFTNMPHGMNQIKAKTGGAAQQHFNVGGYNALKMILPPLSLQNEFASFVQQIDKSKLAVQKSLEKAETLYKSLMQEYFG